MKQSSSTRRDSMDFTRLTQGEKIAGVSGIALILIMFIFDWFGLKADVAGFTAEGSRNAWGSYGFIDIVLFITVSAAVVLALISASQTEVGLPVEYEHDQDQRNSRYP